MWRAWLTTVVAFHLANALLLNITFSSQVIVYLAFVDLLWLGLPAVSRLRRPVTALALVVGAWHVVMRIDERGSGFFGWAGGSEPTYLYDVSVCIAVCIIGGGLLLNDVRHRIPNSDDRVVTSQPRRSPGHAASG